MTTLVKSALDVYEDLMANADPETSKWPLMEDPGPTLVLVAAYVLFVKVIGPIWMNDKQPYDLRYTMVVYNFGLVIASCMIVFWVCKILMKPGSQWFCRVNDFNDPDTIWLIELGYWYFIMKFIEFADTIFFVLRKKNNQISTLHVVHHAVVPIVTWATLRIEPGSTNYFFPFINTIVHIVMYSYYGLAALGPSVKKYLWWKKYLTILQLIQFMSVFIYVLVHMVSSCKVSKFFIYMNSSLAGLFLFLFLNFFRETYVKKRQQDLDDRKDR